MVSIYVQRILDGVIEVDDVPKVLRDKVRKALEEL